MLYFIAFEKLVQPITPRYGYVLLAAYLLYSRTKLASKRTQWEWVMTWRCNVRVTSSLTRLWHQKIELACHRSYFVSDLITGRAPGATWFGTFLLERCNPFKADRCVSGESISIYLRRYIVPCMRLVAAAEIGLSSVDPMAGSPPDPPTGLRLSSPPRVAPLRSAHGSRLTAHGSRLTACARSGAPANCTTCKYTMHLAILSQCYLTNLTGRHKWICQPSAYQWKYIRWFSRSLVVEIDGQRHHLSWRHRLIRMLRKHATELNWSATQHSTARQPTAWRALSAASKNNADFM